VSISDAVAYYKDKLLQNQDAIMRILCLVETKQTAEDEFNRSINCLDELHMQSCYLMAGKVNNIVSFLPLNQPLYSLFLFAIVPSLTASKVFFRPPALLWSIFGELETLLEFSIASSAFLCRNTRGDFIKHYTAVADVVIFAGEYSNVMDIKKHLKADALLLFNGGALNPMVITASASISDAVNDVVRERLFNSGQDCMAPACIAVDENIANVFLEQLSATLKSEVVGLNSLPHTTVGQMIEQESIGAFKAMLNDYGDKVVVGGQYDENNRLIEPTVICFDSLFDVPQQIYYAPVFFIGKYRRISDVAKFLNTDVALELNGYLSLYTSNKDDISYFKKTHRQVLVNESLFVCESASNEFGGFGEKCSFSSFNGKKFVHPLLISKEIAMAFYNIE
jgi:aldehyde dehydrogenase (NAD+)